jgi:hypothetical protein
MLINHNDFLSRSQLIQVASLAPRDSDMHRPLKVANNKIVLAFAVLQHTNSHNSLLALNLFETYRIDPERPACNVVCLQSFMNKEHSSFIGINKRTCINQANKA